ncbi:hypothetical protein VE01_08006 [Pseudogymnoascus verrucosus]|uniref:Tyrosyl-DNA phosphodiesterase 1 n=1 Tax=Pseudogymnoascus verrucosus TaxID=342668 RepID=A0A1B8GCS3_9PEZI|nr:uncharacterized protein VE01_08006 [Pseudogymnoascus verrucosus]OBT93631.1 hypothetical protein VE01_08006 [Pseudogymnoascus verrucosus]
MPLSGQSEDATGGDEPPRKRARTTGALEEGSTLSSLRASISPPRPRITQSRESSNGTPRQDEPEIAPGSLISSPFQLTRIRDSPGSLNNGSVSLGTIVCDPMIREMWQFNYMHDLDFLMSNMDPDTKDMVKIHVVHGYWKKESGLHMKSQALQYPNVHLRCAYMPEIFGTHHTKMMVLLRHDDQAQIIIHTANMIPQDWANLSQAAWTSPLLPLLPAEKLADQALARGSNTASYGSGLRFKLDFLGYLKAYDSRRTICRPLIEELLKYDFSSIRGALVGHVPGRHHVESDNPTLFGWSAIRAILNTIPAHNGDKPEVVAQVSSIATLGVTDQWLQKTLFAALAASSNSQSKTPKLGIVFPTPDEIRKSLDGYNSGGSIHVKIQTAAQAKQLQYLKPLFYHWSGENRPVAPPSTSAAAPSTVASTVREAWQNRAGPSTVASTPSTVANTVREAGRNRAAPHIKTYIRFADEAKTRIDWALVTSANLSKQAWGEGLNAAGDVRICSYELGVLVSPSMYAEDAVMVPTFQTDVPKEAVDGKITIGFRMPYDLPLVRYGADEEPWCATKAYEELDWMGRSYGV